MPNSDIYRIEIDGEWTLDDFYEFPHAYTQTYSFLYSLIVDAHQSVDLQEPYNPYPWIGGYSTVNFYRNLYKRIPKRERPIIVSISYSSPGWIEISVVLAVAYALRKIISNLTRTARDVDETYNQIYQGMQKRKLLKIEAKKAELDLKREHMKFLEESSETFSKLLGFENLQELIRMAPNRLAALKMLLSFYRRIRKLKDYEDQDRLDF